MKRVDIGSIAGIDEAIKFLQTEMSKKAMQSKADDIASELIGEAVEVARDEYMGTGVQVSRSDDTGIHTIVATDPDIAFIEFGIGLGVNTKVGNQVSEFSKESNGAPEVSVGSWSRAVEGPFARHGYHGWHYNGEWVTGLEPENLPRPGMEMARQYVTDERNIADAVRKVIGND